MMRVGSNALRVGPASAGRMMRVESNALRVGPASAGRGRPPEGGPTIGYRA